MQPDSAWESLHIIFPVMSALSLSQLSDLEHPLGKAIVDRARSLNIELDQPENFKALPGMCITAEVSGHRVAKGNKRLMKKVGVSTGEFDLVMEKISKKGQTPGFVAVDGKISGIISMADRLKDHASLVIGGLKKMGMEIVLITGDYKDTAEAIAAEAGIEKVYSEVLPGQKAQKIKELQEQGMVVAMVGDGINDAPALVQSDMGIALGTGTDIAIEAGKITLVGGDLNGVLNAINLSRSTVRIIRQNLF